MAGNTFGEAFKVTTFGESHGAALGCIIDGCPAGLAVDGAFLQAELDRRRPGQGGAAVTTRKESDTAEILSGVFEGMSTGTPIAILIRNTSQRSGDYSNIQDKFRPAMQTTVILQSTASGTTGAAAGRAGGKRQPGWRQGPLQSCFWRSPAST